MFDVYDSLTKQKKAFQPLHKGCVNIYVCGVTVYDYCHIGHARPMVVFDMICRYLRKQGYDVNYVVNITDIDDKIINRAKEHVIAIDELTQKFIAAMHEDREALHLLPPNQEPRATDYIPSIIHIIEDIIKNGHAYVAENGDVCFDVRSFKEYGKLSHRNIDELQVGARVDIDNAKRDPLDFVLWKMSKPDEPSWDSPWGKGRPGWHIECSAMSTELLGQPFDIHGGGMDLKFPHHENEVAQSEAAACKGFANYWMHVGLLRINGEKMSKSLNNFFTIRDILAKHHYEVVRYFMINSHYRSPVNYSEENLAQLRTSLERLYGSLRGMPKVAPYQQHPLIDKFNAAMNDDFNTPVALAVLNEMSREINSLRDANQNDEAAKMAATLKDTAEVMGLLQQDPDVFIQGDVADLDVQYIEQLIASRDKARQEKNWAEADRIRDELKELQIEVEDGADGARWRRL